MNEIESSKNLLIPEIDFGQLFKSFSMDRECILLFSSTNLTQFVLMVTLTPPSKQSSKSAAGTWG